MKTTERFTDMASVQRERERLKAVRDERLHDLDGHWQRMGDPALRRSLVLSTVKNALRPLFSFSGAKELASGFNAETLGGLAALFFGGRAKTMAGKALAMGLSAAIPYFSKRLHDAGDGHVKEELRTSWERVKTHVRERREARRQEHRDEAQ